MWSIASRNISSSSLWLMFADIKCIVCTNHLRGRSPLNGGWDSGRLMQYDKEGVAIDRLPQGLGPLSIPGVQESRGLRDTLS
jgi:hypothetical protein